MSTHDEEQTAAERALGRAIGVRIQWWMRVAAPRRRTQTELSEFLHVDQSGVSKKLRGDRPFSVAELYAIAQWLGRPVGDIVADRDDLGEPPALVPRVRRSSSTRVRSVSNHGCMRTTRIRTAHRPVTRTSLAA